MRQLFQSSTQKPIIIGPLIDSSDHISPKTGVSGSITVTISKNGGSFAAPAGSISEIGNGLYAIAANATDNNTLGPLWVHVTGTGIDPYDIDYEVVGVNWQLQYTQADLRTWKGATPDDLISGRPSVYANVLNYGTVAAAGTNFVYLDPSTAPAIDSYFRYCQFVITGGTGKGQTAFIQNYNSSRLATMTSSFATTPDLTSQYEIIPWNVNGYNVISIGTGALGMNAFGNDARLFLSPQILVVTGTSSPTAANGNYYVGEVSQVTNGQYVYRNPGANWSIWYDATQWILSAGTGGSYGTNYWKSTGDETGPWITGGGSVTGTPVVKALRMPTSGKNPTLVTANADGRTQSDLRTILGTDSQGAAGYVGTDHSKIANPTASVGLTNTTISNSQSVASVSGNVGGSVASVAAGVSLATGAITASKIATDAIGATQLAASAVAEIVAAILTNPNNKIVTNDDGSVNALINGGIPFYITIPPSVAASSQIPGMITAYNYATLEISPQDLGNIAGRSKLWVTAKDSLSDPDSAALFQIEESAGLIVSAGSPITEGTPTLGIISVSDDTTGAWSFTVDETIMALLTPSKDRLHAAYWDVKVKVGSTTRIITGGRMQIIAAVTRSNE